MSAQQRNNELITTSYEKLFAWSEKHDFTGFDPFDGLNSRYFQITPLRKITLARLVWLQTIKRSPINLRPFLKIPAGENSKGIALFALAELSRFRESQNLQHKENVNYLIHKLDALKIQNPKSKIQNRTAFGYNFDWQSRAFFAPRGTPTIVPTAFAARAFLEAFELYGDENYLTRAVEIGEFIVSDLNRSVENENHLCFSYTPLDRSIIYNASLLAGETLASVGATKQNDEWLKLAAKTVKFVLSGQNADDAWEYGTKLRHRWVDNFHTAFILSSLWRMKRYLPELNAEIEQAVRRGYDFWTNNLFLMDGAPKYFNSQTFPIDIHSAAAAIVALCDLSDLDDNALNLAERVAFWTIDNLLDQKGFFYYQKHRFYKTKTPYIRWGQAWMAFALARLLEVGASGLSPPNEPIDEQRFQ